MKTITTVCTDDIDGTAGAEPYTIAVDGYTIEIDLCQANVDKLFAALRPYLDNGRRVAGSRKPRRRQPPRLGKTR